MYQMQYEWMKERERQADAAEKQERKAARCAILELLARAFCRVHKLGRCA